MSAPNLLTELQQAIFLFMWTTENDFKDLCLGGFHHNNVPKNSGAAIKYPFVAYYLLSQNSTEDTKDKYSLVRLQFKLVDEQDSVLRINSVIAELVNRFSDCESSLLLTNYITYSVNAEPIRPPFKNDSGNWEANVDFLVQLQLK